MASDAALVAALAEGREDALAELLRRYERPLAHFIYRHTAGRDVEDLYQETWLRVVRHARRFDPARRFSTWLFQIAINLCRDWHRRPRPEPSGAALPESGTTSIEGTEARLDVLRLLAQLPEAQREVILLRYYHDLSEAEVADIVGCPRGTVKSRTHQALARLAALMREEDR